MTSASRQRAPTCWLQALGGLCCHRLLADGSPSRCPHRWYCPGSAHLPPLLRSLHDLLAAVQDAPRVAGFC